MPLIKGSIKGGKGFVFYGILKYAARPGKLTEPSILDRNGNVIKQGTVLLQLSTAYWKDRVESAKSAMRAAEANLLTDTENYKRMYFLMNNKSVSVADFQNARSAYYNSLAEVNEAKYALEESKLILSSCATIAAFEGIVVKVLAFGTYLSGEPPAITVAQLNPVGIKVMMSDEEIARLTINTPVSISRKNGTTDQGIYYGLNKRIEGGIIFYTKNSQRFEKNIIGKYKNAPVVKNIHSVVRFFVGHKPSILAVNNECIFQDRKGYFVWKAVNEKTLQPDRGISPSFIVEKVYAEPDNMQRMYGGLNMVRALKPSDCLKKNDLVLKHNPKGLKSGDRVIFPQERYIFMLGDEVEVDIKL
ncbi:MAG TPA: hypothetical protein QF753_05760 [Victivallales bacterium]|nr:hypothetical protein [Victivallales bacterium]